MTLTKVVDGQALAAQQYNDLIDGLQQFPGPEGFLINGKIVPSVASNNLTLAIKTLAGTDPSATDPVGIRIGDTIRVITSALSVICAAGTNWSAAGSAELATLEHDRSVYLGYNATDGVLIAHSRIPYATLYSDFSTTNTDEKYAAIGHAGDTTPGAHNCVAGTPFVNIGRFPATLSAGAGHTWTLPTLTGANLIQRPCYEGRRLSWTPALAAGSGTFTSASATGNYMMRDDGMDVEITVTITTNGTAAVYVRLTAPFTPPVLLALVGKETNVTGKMVTVQSIDITGTKYYAIVDYANAYPGGDGHLLFARGFVRIKP